MIRFKKYLLIGVLMHASLAQAWHTYIPTSLPMIIKLDDQQVLLITSITTAALLSTYCASKYVTHAQPELMELKKWRTRIGLLEIAKTNISEFVVPKTDKQALFNHAIHLEHSIHLKQPTDPSRKEVYRVVAQCFCSINEETKKAGLTAVLEDIQKKINTELQRLTQQYYESSLLSRFLSHFPLE